MTLIANHLELAHPSDRNNLMLKYDSTGIFVVGKLQISRSKKRSFLDHIFWGALHPRMVDNVAAIDIHRGYSQHCYKGKTPVALDSALAECVREKSTMRWAT